MNMKQYIVFEKKIDFLNFVENVKMTIKQSIAIKTSNFDWTIDCQRSALFSPAYLSAKNSGTLNRD